MVHLCKPYRLMLTMDLKFDVLAMCDLLCHGLMANWACHGKVSAVSFPKILVPGEKWNKR